MDEYSLVWSICQPALALKVMYAADYPAGISYHDGPRRYVLGDHGAGPDDRMGTDPDERQDRDIDAYLDAQADVDRLYMIPHEWARTSILNTAGMGKFSSDRTIGEYARDIWRITPQEVLRTNIRHW